MWNKAACTLSMKAPPTGRREESRRGTHEFVRHVDRNEESRFLSSRRRMAVAVNESGPRPRAPACNVESCGSGFYPLQWACMTTVGCVLTSEQHLRLQGTR